MSKLFKQNVALSMIGAAFLVCPAVAQDDLVVRSESKDRASAEWTPHSTIIMVPAGDIDLLTETGQNELDARVRTAVVDACDDALGKAAHPLDELNCRIASIRDANKQVARLVEQARSADSPVSTALASAITLKVQR